MSIALNSFSSLLSSLATGCFIIGCVGYASDRTAFKNLAWITIDEDNTQAWFALKKSYFKTVLGSTTLSYNDGSCVAEYCDKCQEMGESCFSLLVIATVFAFITSCATGSLTKHANTLLQIFSLGLTGVALAASIIGIGMFMSDCYDKIDDATNLELQWGPGSIVVLVGIILMGITAVSQVLGTLCCRGAL